MNNINLCPNGWERYGWLPDERNDDLGEDIVQFKKDPFTIDVGWYPEEDLEKGEYRCVIVIDDYWDRPYETLLTRDLQVVKEWVVSALKLCTKPDPDLRLALVYDYP